MLLQIITSSKLLDFGQIMQVYRQSIEKFGREDYPDLDENRQVLEAEQDFYLYLKTFLKDPDSYFFVWVSEGKYVSAVRVEPYRDGVLIAGMETAPESRRKGYAKQLLCGTVQYLKNNHIYKIYSHIHKDNIPSVKTHLSCGFVRSADYAAYIDGSVDRQSHTYLYQK